MKKRTIMISLVVLGFLLMIGVGFAAWTITNPNATHGAVQEANIQVYEVENNSYSLTFGFVKDATGTETEDSPKIVFGKPNPLNPATPVWLSADSIDNESLTVYVKITVDNKENLPESLPIQFACTKATEWTACTTGESSKSYLAAPTYKIGTNAVTSIGKAAFGEDTGSGSCVLAITFAWGSLFGGANPYTYYNGQTYSSDLAAEATRALQAIYALNEATYKFTIGTVE